MTSNTYILEPEDEEPSDEDFMAELDAALKTPRSAAKKKASPHSHSPVTFPPIIQQWFPHSLTLFAVAQRCRCGATHHSVDGLYLTDMTRNGAIRRTRLGTHDAVPETYRGLPRALVEDTLTIDVCPSCFNPAAITTEPSIEGALRAAETLHR